MPGGLGECRVLILWKLEVARRGGSGACRRIGPPRSNSQNNIVPVVSIGGQETALFLGRGEHIARLLYLHRLLRIDVAPVQIAPPWGVTVLDLPAAFRCRRRARFRRARADSMLREELGGAGGDPNEGYELVTGRMQDALRKLAQARA